MFGGVKVKLGKAHAVEFEAGELLEVFELGNGMVAVFMDINDFRGQIDEVGEEVTELFDGVDAFAAAVVGHKKVLDAREVLRDDKNGAFGMVKGLPQVLVGLVGVGFGIE